MSRWRDILPLMILIATAVAVSTAVGNDASKRGQDGPASPVVEGMSIILPEEDPLDVQGNIVVSGSTEMSPLMRRMYKRFVLEGYRGVMKFYGSGAAAGFKRLCQDGRSDIVMASRTIQAHEVAFCATQGFNPVGFNIGLDALTLVAHKNNEFVENITEDELSLLFNIHRWSDINEEWRDWPIKRYVPALGTAAFDFLIDLVFDGEAESVIHAVNTVFEKDHKYIAQGVASDKYSIGLVGYTYYKKYKASLKLITIDDVAPSEESVASADYLLTIPLLVYTDPTLIREKKQVRAFLVFLLNHIEKEIVKSGYFSTSLPMINSGKTSLLKAMGLMP